jgi:hypothetical protein
MNNNSEKVYSDNDVREAIACALDERGLRFDNGLISQIVYHLDFWRAIIYGVVLALIVGNFNFLHDFCSVNVGGYGVFAFSCILSVSEPIVRYLYRGFALINKNITHYSQDEMKKLLVIFMFEVTALMSLCFGVYGLGEYKNYKYLIIYFFVNWLINTYELKNHYEKIRSEVDPSFNRLSCVKKILSGNTEYCYFGYNDKKNVFVNKSKVMESYVAINTTVFGLLAAILIVLREYMVFDGILLDYKLEAILLLAFIFVLISWFFPQNYFTTIPLYFLFVFIFIVIASVAAVVGVEFFLFAAFFHYVIVSYCYFHLYLKHFMHMEKMSIAKWALEAR